MSAVKNSKIEDIAIPRGGMNTQIPIAEMPPQFSPWIRDFDNEGGFYECRKGCQWMFNAQVNFISALIAHPTNKSRVLFLDTQFGNDLRYYDAVTGVDAYIASSGSFNRPRARPVGFNKNVFFFGSGDAPQKYDGATFIPVTITGPTTTNLVVGFSYRSRFYTFENLGTDLWYGELPGSFGGAFSSFPFASLTSDNGVLMCGFEFTLSSGTDAQALMGVVFDTGEVVVYSGGYPKDPNWRKVTKARIGSPLGLQSIIEVDGDVWVLTKNGSVSMRELLTIAQGDVGAASVTKNIQKYWTQLISDIQANETPAAWTPESSLISYINGSYHQTRNKVVIFVPALLFPYLTSEKKVGYKYERTPGALVYDRETKSWVVHVLDFFGAFNFEFISSYYWPTFDKLLFGTNSTGGPGGEACWEYWGNAHYFDDVLNGFQNQATHPEIHTAFLRAKYQTKINGMLVAHQGPFCKAESLMTVLTQFGQQASGECPVNQVSDQITRDLYNVGGVGDSIQVQLKTETDPLGTMDEPYRVLAIEPLLEPGGGLS